MSTQPIDRRRFPVVRRRRPETGRVIAIAATFVVIFAAAFLLGHTRAGIGALTERLPPSLPTLPTPVPTALSAAPPIELGVATTPPARSKAPAEAAKGPSAATRTSSSIVPAPAVTPAAPAPTTTTAPKVVTTPTPAAPKVPVNGSSGSGSSGSGSSHRSGSSQGTSFDSSG